MRVLGIWFFGLIAAAMIGGMTGHYFFGSAMDIIAWLTGMAVFACARLWLGAPS